MAKTAILNVADRSLAGVGNSKKEIEAIVGDKPENFIQVTAKTFVADEKYASFDEMTGKVKPLSEEEKAAAAEKKARAPAVELAGEYHLAKTLPACAEDHPKKPIWVAIEKNTTVEAAKAACPAENPKRKTNGTYSFASEFRYFLKTGYVGMGSKPAEPEVPAA